MPESDFAVLIPARYESSRFPGKPLVDLAGKPMIQRVWEICADAVGAEHAFVATDDDRIAKACQDFGTTALMTSSACLTGTDRIAEAAAQIDYDFVVNVQGDEPLIRPEDIHVVADAFRRSKSAVVNAMAPIHDEAEWRSPNVPKVIATSDGRLQYMSRAPIPANKQNRFVKGWKQVCIYAFGPEHLRRFAACDEKAPIEAIEDIEILRFQELDIPVRMVELDGASLAVDTPEDVEKVLRALGS